MDLTINARHVKLPESLRNQARQRFSRLERLDRRITAGTLVIESISNEHRAEARLVAAGGPPLIGHADAPTLRAAIDGAIARVERQLKRRRDRRTTRRTRNTVAAAVPADQDAVMP